MVAIPRLPTRDQIAALNASDRMRLVQELDRAERALMAAFVDTLDVMDVAGDHAADGHRSVRNLLDAQTNCDHTSANVKVRAMKTLWLLPDVRNRLAAGEFGVAQVHSLASAYGNPRVRDYLPVVEDQIVDWADLPHDEFDGRLTEFVRLADADGTAQRDTARHERRSLHLSQSRDGFHGSFGCGNTQGVTIKKVLDHFATKEFDADWAEAKARVGGGVTKHDLARTAEQRKMDALQAVCLAAASATPGPQPPAPLVNLVMDTRTCDEIIDCATTGVRIPDADALAAMLRSIRCVWTGCNIPASNCEADHLEPWAQRGQTNADSGAPHCDHHNRWKTRGFTTHVDDTGRWHTPPTRRHQHQRPTHHLNHPRPHHGPQRSWGSGARVQHDYLLHTSDEGVARWRSTGRTLRTGGAFDTT
jgi:hypothetical protein